MKGFYWAILLCSGILSTRSEELNLGIGSLNPHQYAITNLTDIRQRVFNNTVASFLENLDGISEEFLKGAFTYDKDGQPMMYVNKDQVLALSALLMEHDERYHKDFQGHKTIIPSENHCAKNGSCDKDIAEDGHILARSIDDSLTGHVHPKDEDLLQQMIDQPPKLVRVRRACFTGGSVWPNGIVPYVFDKEISEKAKAATLDSQKLIMERVPCIKYVPANEVVRVGMPKSYILITEKGAGCFTNHLGYREGQCLVNLGPGCHFSSVAVHELMHSLGAQHEQLRPDRDDHVEINWPNVEKHRIGQYKMLSPNRGPFDPNEYEYDYRSIMQYAPFTSAINKKMPTMRLKPPDTTMLYRNNVMSKLDYLGLRERYGCPGDLPGDKEFDRIVQVKIAKAMNVARIQNKLAKNTRHLEDWSPQEPIKLGKNGGYLQEKKKREQREKQEKERQEMEERLAMEEQEMERKERERKEKERLARDWERQNQEKEQYEKEQYEKEQYKKEQYEKERQEKERQERERQEIRQEDMSTGQKDDVVDTDNCAVSPWTKWTYCKQGRTSRLRHINQESASQGTCSNSGMTLFLVRKCRSRRDTDEVVGNDGSAEVNMRKTVTVTAGEPIVLVVSNPNNLPVKWYHVVEGEEKEIEMPYTIEQTSVGNEKIVIENSRLYDGHLFVAKIEMSYSMLRIFWSISVV